ncbi:endo-chitosanase [Pseudovirgaria hyperparasitica]|uniref:Endo-chitosanase n=1 Tax=Pseudovirgaria hyperparasitica TaxID=470096 RepID=A0A6A6W8H6_9PEZI|nr:endo-chitosanase [Pseudovirgaria hyperparasitica]KAF2758845.1 endo-chitosanase [Pseudovirgaria hyperparasitica]
MHPQTLLTLLTLTLTTTTTLAIRLPANVKAFYDTHKSGPCKPSNRMSANFKVGLGDSSYGGSSPSVTYCHDTTANVITSKSGGYADMDIDCDGQHSTEGRCSNDGSQQSETAFKDTVAQYGIADLDAHVHPYVVFGNSGAEGMEFSPQSHGVEPLSVVAVVCGGKLIYGIWGDVNGGVVTGEASLSMAQLCFGDDSVSGDNGHGERDVLYIAFPGKEARLGKHDAKWNASTKEEFEASLVAKGNKLVSRL